MDKLFTALGLMSGTSLDGIDASIIASDGDNFIDIKKNIFVSYEKSFKNQLANYINNIQILEDIRKSQNEFDKLERKLTLKHSEISKTIIKESKLEVDLIGLHGQTIIHRPKEKYSVQMGDGKLLSKLLKKKVIYNFRKRDIEKGGEGAPLTPIYHYMISKFINIDEPIIFLNIGGIANLTYIKEQNMMAKDIGPGNVLMDKYIKKNKKIEYDHDGKLAREGKINFDIVNQFIKKDIYNLKNKHSLNREDFDFSFISDLDFKDNLATLNYFTAKTISEYITNNFKKNLIVILCGGGRKNKTLIENIKKISKMKIKKIDDYGIDGDFIESQAFAYLSIRSFLKKNISFPETTKIPKASSGGELVENY